MPTQVSYNMQGTLTKAAAAARVQQKVSLAICLSINHAEAKLSVHKSRPRLKKRLLADPGAPSTLRV